VKIGSSCEYDGLYYLDDGILHADLAAIPPSHTLLQYYYMLGYPSLQKLCQVLPIESSITALEYKFIS